MQLLLYAAVEDDETADFTKARFVGAYTKQPFAVVWSRRDSGRIATYWAQWNTRTGLRGPLSSPVSFVIGC